MTKRLAEQIGAILKDGSPDGVSVECYDLAEDNGDIGIDEETVVVIGMPVYVGKIPLPGAAALSAIDGKGVLALTAVTYGGRSYGNALYELNHITEDCGFKPIGAGAFMHSFMALRGSSRPSLPMMDTEVMSEFCKAASAKIQRLGGSDIESLKIKPMPVEVKGRMPVHKISRISPGAAAIAQNILEFISIKRRSSEWFL